MTSLIGVVQLLLGLALGLVFAYEIRRYGGLRMEARPAPEIASTGTTAVLMTLCGCLIVGGIFLLTPSATCPLLEIR